MSSDDYSTDEDRHNHYTAERKAPQLNTPLATAADRVSPLPHSTNKRPTPSRTPVAAPASPPYLYSSSDTETTDTDDTDSPSSYSASSLSPPSSALHTPRQPSPSFLYDRPSAPENEATPLLPPLTTASSLRSVFAASNVSAEAEGGVGAELVRFMVGVDMELQVFVLRVVCVVLASVAIVSVSAQFTTLHLLLTSPVVIFALAAFFNANSNSALLRHVHQTTAHIPQPTPTTHTPVNQSLHCLSMCTHSLLMSCPVLCRQLLIACTVLCVLELANILLSVLFFSLAFTQLWYDAAVSLTLLVAFILLFDNKRTRDRLTLRYIKQYAADKQRRDEEAREEEEGGGWGEAGSSGGKRRGSVTSREGRDNNKRRRSGVMRERSLSVDEEERRRVVAAGRCVESVDGEVSEKHKPVSILDILQPSNDDGSEASISSV